jgi:hypothetical protein
MTMSNTIAWCHMGDDMAVPLAANGCKTYQNLNLYLNAHSGTSLHGANGKVAMGAAHSTAPGHIVGPHSLLKSATPSLLITPRAVLLPKLSTSTGRRCM